MALRLYCLAALTAMILAVRVFEPESAAVSFLMESLSRLRPRRSLAWEFLLQYNCQQLSFGGVHLSHT